MKTIKKIDLPGIKRLSPLEMNGLHISCAHSPLRARRNTTSSTNKEVAAKKDLRT